MSLTILSTQDEQIAGNTLVELVRACAREGHAVVLVPTFAEVLHVQKALAHEGLSLGVEVTMPSSWVRDMWDVWGDGRRVVEGSARTVLMTRVLREMAQGSEPELSDTPGTVRLLCTLAERALPWLGEALGEHGAALTPAERRAVRSLESYEKLLTSCGLVEGSSCMHALPSVLAQAGVAVPPVVFAGFDELNHANRELVCGLATLAEVTLAMRKAPTLSFEQQKATEALLKQVAESRGVTISRVEGPFVQVASRKPELDGLLRKLFREEAEPLAPTGAVRLLQPAGPLAEAELVAREVAELAHEQMGKVIVVVPDVERAWRELTPKLVARGVSVRAQLSKAPLATESGRAFAGYVRTVAQLVELSKSWPAAQQGADGMYVRVGDMSWWPPYELVDFLLCDIAHTDRAKACSLDMAWRRDRLLSPADVLDQLQSSKLTSDAVERATRELLRGRLGSAASKLLAPYVADGSGGMSHDPSRATSLAREEATAVLAAFLGVASTLKELGMTADPKVTAAVSLAELVQAAELALDSVRVMLRPEAHAQDEKASVLLVDRRTAAALPPASFDTAVLCGLTSTEFAVPAGDGELDGMLADLQIEPVANQLAAQRSLFSKLCALPTQRLLLERSLFAADSHENYPAVMLTELLSCYGELPPHASLSEDEARANLAATGIAPQALGEERVAPAGRIDDTLRRLVMVPQEGRAELPGGLPVLSASQLESYLECPLKWFSLRRLRLLDNDAGFGPLEMGTFVHRVLELTYARLFEEGRAKLSLRDADAMAHAHVVLDEQFRAHREHQHMRVGSKVAYQALIPHNAADEGAMERLHRDLSSTLDYVAARFVGYEPRAFEWEFGRGPKTSAQSGLPALPEATYAGVRVTGTVDRIDVNPSGQAVVIDYKHKGPNGFFAEYAAFGRSGDEEDFVLPRRIQALLYAQVVRRAFPDLRIVGALYLGTRGTHELSGAVAEAQADALFGTSLGSRRAKQVIIGDNDLFGQEGQRGMNAYLDAVEDAIARKVERLREGHIEAEPLDASACAYCPVSNCERRLQ